MTTIWYIQVGDSGCSDEMNLWQSHTTPSNEPEFKGHKNQGSYTSHPVYPGGLIHIKVHHSYSRKGTIQKLVSIDPSPGVEPTTYGTNDNDNDNDNDKVFYSTLIIHFISHITVINAFAY